MSVPFELVVPKSIFPESYDDLIFDAVAVQPSNSAPKHAQ
jgi:hypothetical protein